MATAFHILSAGYDHYLLQSRSMLLRHAGFVVNEAHHLMGVLDSIKSDSIDALVLCHTIPENEQRWLIASVRRVRRLLPIIHIKSSVYESFQEGCSTSTNEPVDLLTVIQQAIQHTVPRR